MATPIFTSAKWQGCAAQCSQQFLVGTMPIQQSRDHQNRSAFPGAHAAGNGEDLPQGRRAGWASFRVSQRACAMFAILRDFQRRRIEPPADGSLLLLRMTVPRLLIEFGGRESSITGHGPGFC